MFSTKCSVALMFSSHTLKTKTFTVKGEANFCLLILTFFMCTRNGVSGRFNIKAGHPLYAIVSKNTLNTMRFLPQFGVFWVCAIHFSIIFSNIEDASLTLKKYRQSNYVEKQMRAKIHHNFHRRTFGRVCSS